MLTAERTWAHSWLSLLKAVEKYCLFDVDFWLRVLLALVDACGDQGVCQEEEVMAESRRQVLAHRHFLSLVPLDLQKLV